MLDEEQKHWLDQLEVTGPIKGIMSFVDELSQNYDRRLAALHIEYQKDVEEILACYKTEKQEFSTQLDDLKAINSTLEMELKAIRQNYHALTVEHKITKECLETTKQELSELTKALKQEDELMETAKAQIQSINSQLREELSVLGVQAAPEIFVDADLDTTVIKELPVKRARKPRFKRTRAFFRQVILDRLSRPIIIRPKKEPIVTDKFDEPHDLESF